MGFSQMGISALISAITLTFRNKNKKEPKKKKKKGGGGLSYAPGYNR